MANEPLHYFPMLLEPSKGRWEPQEQRNSIRHILPPGVPASIRLDSGSTCFVTLGDISRTGASVVRRGSLKVHANDDLFLLITDFHAAKSVSLPARVMWMNLWSYETHIGLVFLESPLLPGTMLDQYLDKALMPPGRADA